MRNKNKKQETQQRKQTKQKQNVTKQQNKPGKPNIEKPNLPKITLYLTKNTSTIEARAAAFEFDDNKLDVTTQPSKDNTSVSSRMYNQSDGIETEPQTKPGDAAKGLQ